MNPQKKLPIDYILEKPFLSMGLLVFFVFVILFMFFQSNKPPETIGDQASADSAAFLVFEDAAYFPFNNVISDTLVRDDVAFYARQTIPEYNPKKNPNVVFNISKKTSSSSENIDINGKFEKSKDVYRITVKPLKNNRVKVTITNTKTNSNIDSKLPSGSKENIFITRLPFVSQNYRIDYIESDGSIVVLIGERNSAYKKQADDVMKKAIGKNDLSSLDIGYTYPTDAI